VDEKIRNSGPPRKDDATQQPPFAAGRLQDGLFKQALPHIRSVEDLHELDVCSIGKFGIGFDKRTVLHGKFRGNIVRENDAMRIPDRCGVIGEFPPMSLQFFSEGLPCFAKNRNFFGFKGNTAHFNSYVSSKLSLMRLFKTQFQTAQPFIKTIPFFCANSTISVKNSFVAVAPVGYLIVKKMHYLLPEELLSIESPRMSDC
jgi:hypothetical protein